MDKILKVYLAGSYRGRADILEKAKELATKGILTTSRWLSGISDAMGNVDTSGAHERLSTVWATEDLLDIDRAHILVLCNDIRLEDTTFFHSGGGKFVEMGYAVAQHKTIMVVGPIENIFQYLPGIIRQPDWGAALDHLLCLSEDLELGEGHGNKYNY